MSTENDYQACLKAEEVYNQVGKKYDKAVASNALTPELKASLEKEDENLFEEAKKTFAHFFENHINSTFGQKIFSETRWTRRLSPEQLESVVNHVKDGTFKGSDTYAKAVQRIQNMRASKIGSSFRDITSKNPDGDSIALLDFVGKGKYVLLDFWASWCPDCVKDMPDLAELYERYKGSNFEIVSYSLDTDHEAWTTGINKLGMIWPQMSDLGSWNSPGVELYAVQSIPCTILIDLQGKVIERGLVLSALAKKLEVLLK